MKPRVVPPPGTPCRRSASSGYPDIYKPRVAGRAATSRSASSRPFIPGITTSVSRRWIVPAYCSAMPSASLACRQAKTVYPWPWSALWIQWRTPSSSSASRMVSSPWDRAIAARVTGAGSARAPARGGGGEVDLDRRPLPRLALHRDEAVALLDDPVHHREAEPGPLAERLGGEERLEEVGADLGRHAAAGIGHGEEHVGTPRRNLVVLLGGRGQLHVPGLDRHPAAFGHGVARVDDQVHDRLLQLSRIRLDRVESRAQGHLQLDVLADHPAEHALHRAHQGVEIDEPGLHHLAAAEREQPVGESLGPERGLLDLGDHGGLVV